MHYSPNDPSEAVLEPGIVLSFQAFDIDPYILVGAGMYLIVLGILGLNKGINKRE